MFTPETFRDIVSGRRRGWAAFTARGILSLAERAYRAAITWRNRRFDQGRADVQRVDVPVISVGNLTLGGTGKTPLVAWLARWYRRRHVRVTLISRGYGAKTSLSNDEFRELAARLPDVPHLQNPDRVAAAWIAIDELETQLILLDDGFQHRRLARDLDIVLVDATEPFGYERVFPRGMLREPIASLRRADVIALTRCNLVSAEQRESLHRRIQSVAAQAVLVDVAQRPATLLTASGVERRLEEMPNGPILAFCGIGNPSAFRQTLVAMGWPLDDMRVFPDHHDYDHATIVNLKRWASGHPQSKAVICTHKDLVKIRVDRLGPLPLFALTLQLEIGQGREDFEAKLQSLLPAVAAP
jgi:tetraacyldisaccharide 4'-kinase